MLIYISILLPFWYNRGTRGNNIMKYKPIDVMIGERLKAMRNAKKYSLRYVGEKMGRSNVTISNYETGRLSIDLPTLKKLCALYGVDMLEFLAEIYEAL